MAETDSTYEKSKHNRRAGKQKRLVVGNFGTTPYHTHPSATGQAAITWRTYYSSGESRIALRVQGNSASYDLYYFLVDNLNSTTKVIKQDGTVSEIRYSAWGETRYSNGTIPSQLRYTGQNQAEAGLYFFGSRWYDSALGRFIQPDTIIPDPNETKAFDRFSFVANNPITYTDPSGHCWGVASFIRGLPSYGTTCNNLDMAIQIITHPQETLSQQDGARAYVLAVAYTTGEFVAHGTAVVYGGAAVCGYASAACYKALTSGSGIVGLLCRDGDCTNEANTAGQSVQSALKTAQSVNDKLQRYLLNPDHPVGGSKAQWFEKALGFTKDNIADLAKQIVFNPQTAVQTEVTQFGVKYNQIISITGANGRQIDVLFVWIRNSDGIIRLVTAIPGSK